jgi:hypothetical protein
MTYSDNYNLRTKNVKFNDVADAIDGSLTRSYGGTSTGVVNQYISSPTPSWTSYEPGQLLVIIPHITNTGASTVNVNGLGAKSIKRAGADVVAGDLVISTPTVLVYSGAYFESLIIQNAINRDGTNSPTANLPMGGFKHTGVGNASSNDQYVAYGQIRNGTPFYLDTANNRIGINKTNPTVALDVTGDIYGSGTISSPTGVFTTGYLSTGVIGNGTTASNLSFRNYNNNNGAWVFSVRTDVGGTNQDLKLLRYTSGGTVYSGIAMQFNNTYGTVAIGTTTSINTIGPQLDIGPGLGAFGYANQFYLGSNFYYDGGWRYKATAGATVIIGVNNGDISFNTAASGTIDTAISFAERMRLYQNGSLYIAGATGIGAAPSATYALNINGAGYFAGAGIAFGGATIIGSGNQMGLRWGSPNIYGTVDNAVQAVLGTVSDYRLKANFTPQYSALSIIEQIRPGTYNPIELDGEVCDKEHWGIIAHELKEIIPCLVIGEKDAVNEEGNPIYQSVDYAGLVPYLIVAVQELSKKIEALNG